jgi:TonB family protein
MSSIKNIHFSFPCKENINDMDSCGLNKHCKTCDRKIIDFRSKSAEELAQLKKTNQSICGIFSEKQVAKGYERYFQLAAATALTIGLSSSFQNLYAQEEEDPFKLPATKSSGVVCPTVSNQMDIVGVIVDDSPEYPGGWAALKDFLKENIVYPADSIEGKVYVSFTVDTVGHVTDIKIKKSLSPLADAEVIRVVKLLVFKPAVLEGRPINSRFSLPVTFSREKKK